MARQQETKQQIAERLAREEAARTREPRPDFDLPAGYEDAGLDAVSVDWRETPEVSGKVIGFDTLNTDNGERRVMLLASGGASLMVWESAALRRLFSGAAIGDEVYIRATGSVEVGKGRAMRTFKAAIKRASPAARPGHPGPRAPAPKGKGVDDDIPF